MAKPKPDYSIPVDPKVYEALLARNGLYLEDLADSTKKAMLAALIKGIETGAGIDELIASLEEVGFDESRAELIARTEVMYALNSAALDRYEQDGIEKVEWLAGPDDRMCDYCGEMDGTVYAIADAPELPAHPDCRCDWVPVVE